MTKKQIQQQQLKEVSGLVGTLTERMMTAYAVGSRPTDGEVKAFCRGVLLLEEHGIPLPQYAHDVVDRLQARDEETKFVAEIAKPAAPVVCGASILKKLMRPIRILQAVQLRPGIGLSRWVSELRPNRAL